MSLGGMELFNLLPAYIRRKDAELAQTQVLLTADEQSRLAALQAAPLPLSPTDQSALEALKAKAARGPLQSLMQLIAEQVAAVEEDLEQLYDDQFIETCAPWVVPYIGDLIGYQSVHGIASSVASPRAEVAHTISFRRRKGTVLVMEQLARDVTGWGAHAVEFFRLLGDTQYMNHVRPHNYYAPDLRKWEPRVFMNTGFDATAHTVDVRRIASGRGRYNIANVGIFLWSINSYQLLDAALAAAPAGPAEGASAPASSSSQSSGVRSSSSSSGRSSSSPSSSGGSWVNPCYRFSTVGRDAPLFNRPVSQGSDITAPADPSNVPDRLRRHVLCKDMQGGAGAVYYGEGKSLAVAVDGVLLSPYQVQVCNLSGPDGAWINLPARGSPYLASVDPELGRLALAPIAEGATPPAVTATACHGLAGAIGGGGYPRNNPPANAFVVPAGATYAYPAAGGSPGSLLDAVQAALATLPPEGGQVAVEIDDNGIHTLEAEGAAGLGLHVPAGATLELRAADMCRPTLVLGGALSLSGGAGSSLFLNGLLLTTSVPYDAPVLPLPPCLVEVPALAPDGSANNLGVLGITHCTLVPGMAWTTDASGRSHPLHPGVPVLVASCAGLGLQVASSILGSVQVQSGSTASFADSLLDATDPTGVAYAGPPGFDGFDPAPGGALTLTGCTVVGKVRASLLSLVSNSVVWASMAPPSDSLAVSSSSAPSSSGGGGGQGPGVSGSSSAASSGSPPASSSSGSGSSAGATPWAAALWASRSQEGCVRFSFIPEESIVPKPFACVVRETGGPQPLFVSLNYGDPGYGKLLVCTEDAVRRGADDGGEMGAFHFVLAPLRETDLRIRMQEYLPVGLEFGIIYET